MEIFCSMFSFRSFFFWAIVVIVVVSICRFSFSLSLSYVLTTVFHLHSTPFLLLDHFSFSFFFRSIMLLSFEFATIALNFVPVKTECSIVLQYGLCGFCCCHFCDNKEQLQETRIWHNGHAQRQCGHTYKSIDEVHVLLF